MLVGNEKVLLEKMVEDFGLKCEHMQNIPDNYTMVGEPYGIYYDTEFGHVKELWIHNVMLTSLPRELIKFPMLEKLVVSGASIEYIDPLISKMPSLKYLDLSNNSIKDISGVSEMRYLKELNLSNNALMEINGLESLSGLEVLNLEGNLISMVDNLDTSINRIGFVSTKIKISEKKQSLDSLKVVNLKNNLFPCDLYNMTEIDKLKSKGIKIISDCD